MNLNPLDIAVGLYNHYQSLQEVKHYYGLLAIYALVQASEVKADPRLRFRCQTILRRFPDEIEHRRYNFPSYTIGGIPKAYAYWRKLLPEARSQVEYYAEEMMAAARDPQGIMKNPHRPDEDLIWIDTAMAVTPYLLFAGLALEREQYLAEAVKQTLLMYDVFTDAENGLLHQCKNFVGPGKLSEDHWGRGNGWGYIALTELVQHLPHSHPQRKKVEEYFVRHSQALLPHQSKRGLWRQEIPFPYAYEESSGTGLILYGFGVGLRLGLLQSDMYWPAFHQGILALYTLCIGDDYSTALSCPGCLCPGEGEDKGTVQAYVTLRLPYKDEPHSFAPLMLAMVEAYRNGLVTLPAKQ